MLVQQLADCLRLLADPLRLRLLALCGDGPATVTDLAAALGATEPAVSRHLKALAGAGIVRRTRRGQFVEYARHAGGAYPSLVTEALAQIPVDDAALRRARLQLSQRAARQVASGLRRSGPRGDAAVPQLDASLLAVLGAAHARRNDGGLLVVGGCPARTLAALASSHARLWLAAATVAQRTALRRRLSDAGLAGDVLLRAEAPRLLRGESLASVYVDATGPQGPATLEAELRWIRALLGAGGRCWVLADYDALEAQAEGRQAPPLLLRAQFERQGFLAERIHPIEADGEHRLLAEAGLRSALRGVQAA